MAFSLEDKLVVAISSRALFDFEEENCVYETGDLQAYEALQRERLNVPAKPGVAFPLIRKLLGGALKDVLVQHGSGGAAPGTPPEYAVITVLRFESMPAFQAAFMPHAPAITSDIANFTNVEPTIQFSDVRLG